MKTPPIREARMKFNSVRRKHQENLHGFLSDRNKTTSKRFQAADSKLEQATREALVALDPSLGLVLDKKAVAQGRARMHEGRRWPTRTRRRARRCCGPKKPGLPRVLLIGYSISIGDTLKVREFRTGKANVQRIPASGRTVEYGLESLAKWLGAQRWNVVHFNFGLNDAKYVSSTEVRVPRATDIRCLQTTHGSGSRRPGSC